MPSVDDGSGKNFHELGWVEFGFKKVTRVAMSHLLQATYLAAGLTGVYQRDIKGFIPENCQN